MAIEHYVTCNSARRRAPAVGARVPFDAAHDPGAYVCNWSGHLLRVAVTDPRRPRPAQLNLVGPEPLFVTKISDNPLVPVRQARSLAAGLALDVNF
jgi:hypothetical protein